MTTESGGGKTSVEGAPQRFGLNVAVAGVSGDDLATLSAYRWQAAGGADAGGAREVAAAAAERHSKPPLVIVHGFGEHARRHAELARTVSAAGHAVLAVDLPGHGDSPGPRAVVAGYADALEVVDALLARAGREGADAAPVLFGHSMGGAIALSFALEHPARLSGLVLSSPFLLDAVERPAWLRRVGSAVARLAPRLPVTKLDASLISRDPAEVARYRLDPLNRSGGVPAVTGHTLTSAGAELLAAAPSLSVPTLILHGEADGVAAVEGSRSLARAAPLGTVKLIIMPGGFHELFHDDAASGVPQRAAQAVLDFLARPQTGL
ncbi:MAG TPA: alpha/beta hydrolase [Trueperaceae bacterium]|nr:alpha/beta hydrolase [Trueperaceae bacterium]